MRKFLFVVLCMLVTTSIYAFEGDDPTRPTPPGDFSVGGNSNMNDIGSHGLHLNGIFSQSNNYTVVVNGKVLHQGDSIEGYKVSNISKNSVTLKSNTNESFELKFSDFNFKQPHH
jgi:hypothetical protein